jgi:hypothetical protein
MGSVKVSKDYMMFSAKGNELVGRVVAEARVQGWDWPKTQRHLQLLAKAHPKDAGEAFDTSVREVVYVELDCAKYGESFYG